jgi:hypothetical protein
MLMSHKSSVVAIALIGMCGCFNDVGSHLPATTSTAGDIKLSDAIPLEQIESDDVQVTLTDKITSPATLFPIYFGEADTFDSDDPDTAIASIPVIAVCLGSDWKAVPLPGPGLENAGWKYVASGPALHEVWGVLDTAAGDSGPDFVVAHSIDGAMSFTLKTFHKPASLATVADFAISQIGRGRVTLSLDTNCGPNKAGLYHYETNDDGKTWSKIPRYEPDVMIRAATVMDDEQPSPIEKPLRTLFHHRSSTTHASRIFP